MNQPVEMICEAGKSRAARMASWAYTRQVHHAGLRWFGAAAQGAAARRGGGLDRHPDVRTVHRVFLRRRQQVSFGRNPHQNRI